MPALMAQKKKLVKRLAVTSNHNQDKSQTKKEFFQRRIAPPDSGCKKTTFLH